MTTLHAHPPESGAHRRPGSPIPPVRIPRGRLLGIDVVRAVAIIGVFVMHFHITGWWQAGAPDAAPELIDWVQEHTSSRAMSLFVLLAGVAVALMTGGARPYRGREMALARRRVFVRAIALFAIGLCISQFAPSVLEFYALLLVLLLPFTRLRARTLAALSALAIPVVTLYTVWVMNNHLDWLRTETPTGFAVLTQPDRLGDYLFALAFYGGGFQTVYGIPLVLAGLAIGRLDLHDNAVRVRMAIGGLCLAVTAWLVSLLAPYLFADAATADDLAPNWRAVLEMPGLYATSAVGIAFMIGVALLLLGVFLAVMDRPLARRLLWPLVATGGMTMTWYAAHLLFLYLLDPPTLFSFVGFAAFVAAVLVLSTLWRHWFRRGPLEWLVHKAVSYG